MVGLLGLMVILRNTHDTSYRLFGFFTAMTILWGIANYSSNHVSGYDPQLFANKFSLFVGFLLIQSVWLLSMYFPRKINEHKIQKLISILITPIVLYLTLLTDQIVKSIVYQPEKNITDINIGNSYFIYVASAAVFFMFVVSNFFRAYKAKDTTRLQRQQISYAATGLLLSFLWALLTAAVIPTLTGNWEISKYGAVGMIFTVGFISFSIIRHRLFDIRLIIVRATAYALLVGTLSAIYGISIFGLTNTLLKTDSVLKQQILPILVALVLVFTAPFLRRLFNRITNKIFYRDAYDPQAFLDELNSTIVGNIEIGVLLRHTTAVIQKNLKCEHCFIEIRETSTIQGRVMGVGSLQLTKEESGLIFRSLEGSPKKTLVSDMLEYDKDRLRNILSENKIGLITKLVPGHGKGSKPIAHLIIGQKKSGNIYDKNDIRIVEIISDELLIAIQNALRFEEIQQFNATLQEKVNEATAKLQKTNKKLRALDETKDEFISMASHQLRTPLTTVKGYMSMVLEGDAGKLTKMQQELLEQAFISSQRMVYLIADLLNVSRLRSGKFVLDLQPTNLAEVVEGEITQLSETASAKGLDFKFKKPKKFPELMLDETKIRQVIMNFSDNAIYYTPKGGSITIELKEDKNNVYFTVKDTGLGVPASEKSHLFTKFYRASNAKNARPDGTGLGLFMAKKVVDVLGGSIIFETEEGKGSTFGFTFEKHKLRVNQPTLPSK